MTSNQFDENLSADSQAAEAALTSERGPAPEQVDGKGQPEDSVESDSQTSKSPLDDENPPLPSEEPPPPLPNGTPPGTRQEKDDGWEAVWAPDAQAFYFYNRFSGNTQWENPRVPEASQQQEADVDGGEDGAERAAKRPHGGYDPSIHGDYDPNASYAVEARQQEEAAEAAATAGAPGAPDYSATGQFNRFTGKWQAADVRPENYNDENKSKRQMNAYFDVDAAANSHNGKSLKAERSAKKISKQELKAFKDKRREKKEEKRRAWLRD